MSIDVGIVGTDSGVRAKVTPFGQLVVAPADYSIPVAESLSVAGTAVNFIDPSQDQQVVITDIIASADKNVSSTTPADLEVYQATAPDTATVLTSIVRPQLIRSGNFILTGLNLLIPSGVWVNAKTDDAAILLTIMYYRVPVDG